MIAMLKPVSPFLEYLVNKDYIAQFLCVNKDKPEMACGGKCHLMKELEKEEKESLLILSEDLSSTNCISFYIVLAEFSAKLMIINF